MREEKKLKWLTDEEWEYCGYKLHRKEGRLILSRGPIDRFEGVQQEQGITMVGVKRDNIIDEVISRIKLIKVDNKDLAAEDLAIAFITNNRSNYNIVKDITQKIYNEFDFKSIIGYKSKEKKEGYVFISNINNIKGLEFPFLIYFEIGVISDNFRKRNSIYTLLTRSFIKTIMIL